MKQIIPFDPTDLNHEWWLDYYNYTRVYNRKHDIEDTRSFKEFKKIFSESFTKFSGEACFFLLKENKIVGDIYIYVSNKEEKNEVQRIEIETLAKDTLTIFKSDLEEFIDRQKLKWLKTTIVTNSNELIETLENLKFQKKNNTAYFKLTTKDINQSFIDTSLGNSVTREYSFELNTKLMGKQISEVATMMTTLLNDMEREDYHDTFTVTIKETKAVVAWHEESKNALYHLLLRDNEGKLIGMSIVFIKKQNPKRANQFMTGVLKEYRGKGLSSWMKAFVYQEIMKNHPTIQNFKTDCFAGNYPMIHINKKMGYQETERKVEMVYERD